MFASGTYALCGCCTGVGGWGGSQKAFPRDISCEVRSIEVISHGAKWSIFSTWRPCKNANAVHTHSHTCPQAHEHSQRNSFVQSNTHSVEQTSHKHPPPYTNTQTNTATHPHLPRLVSALTPFSTLVRRPRDSVCCASGDRVLNRRCIWAPPDRERTEGYSVDLISDLLGIWHSCEEAERFSFLCLCLSLPLNFFLFLQMVFFFLSFCSISLHLFFSLFSIFGALIFFSFP